MFASLEQFGENLQAAAVENPDLKMRKLPSVVERAIAEKAEQGGNNSGKGGSRGGAVAGILKSITLD
jgi:hypothetical protein